VGEHGWAPAAGYRQMPLEDARAGESAPVHLEAVAAQYPFRGGPRDQSVSDNAWLRLPVPKIVQIGDLRWNGQAADFLDSGGNVAAFDPSAHSLGPSALLVREELFRGLTHKHDLGIVWTVTGIKTLRSSRWAPEGPGLRFSGAYRLIGDGAYRLYAAGEVPAVGV
jgi:hypothetical protein